MPQAALFWVAAGRWGGTLCAYLDCLQLVAVLLRVVVSERCIDWLRAARTYSFENTAVALGLFWAPHHFVHRLKGVMNE